MLKTKAWSVFKWVFFTLSLADVIALNFSAEIYDFHMILKPLIMASAIYFLIRFLNHRRFYKTILLAFVLAWFGDILLLGQTIDELFFVGGLAAFLLSHIAYIYYFKKSAYRKISSYNGITALQVSIVIIAASLYLLMYTNLADFWIPVLLYVITIAIMGVTALGRYARVNMDTFSFTAIGAFVFILSDSIIGYNKFVAPIPFAESMIMLFYCTAQYMILKGFVVLESED
jgi:uncharacterized membrane protein YhhN